MPQQKAAEAPAADVDDLVDELQPGTKLLKGQYTIVRYINSGGFGITYLAKDSLDRDMVIKECFPSAFCRRSKAMVSARSRAHTAELRSVVQLFVREARHLSKIVHPNIVAVHQVFEDNGTAYMAIDFIDGLDLQQIVEGDGVKPTTEEIILITEKLLAAVGFIHSNDMLHRDISPDNVLIDQKGQPILIDFGAAREQASQANRAMSALRVVKDGYSPQEFYIAGSEQGPWSDLYALGATLYHVISGEAPVNGQARLAALAEDKPDPYLPLAGRFEGYPPQFLESIDKALNTLPKKRVQSAQEWLSMFRPGIVLPTDSTDDIAAAVQAMVAAARAETETATQDSANGGSAVVGAASQGSRQVSQPKPKSTDLASQAVGKASATKSATEVRSSSRSGMSVQLVAGVAVALAVVGLGVVLMRGDDAPATETTTTQPTAVEPVAVTAGNAPTTTAEAAPETSAVTPADTTTAATPEATPEAAPEPEAVVEQPAVTAAVEPPEEEAPVVAEPVAEAPEAEVAAVETPVVAEPVAEAPEAEVAAVETPVVAEPVAEAPETEVAAVEAPASAPDTAAPLLGNQVGFAAWDATLPFLEDNRIIGGQRVAIILRLLPNVDLASAGDWLENGLIIYAINGVGVEQSGSVATGVLNAMQVDPDGKARVVVDYAGSSLERRTGLMTVPVNRLISLESGINLSVSTVDGEWRTIVTGVTSTSLTTLRQGDILFRDKTTGELLNGPSSLETIMASLVASGTESTEFAILRDNKLTDATLQLARESE